jgi:Uma2 family endonuclease
MTLLSERIVDEFPGHVVFYDVDWDFYEDLLKQIGDRPLRVTYDNGALEIMSPLPEHEWVSRFICWMVQTLALELDVPIRTQGSTTYRKKSKQKGLEPDECFYVQKESKLRGKRSFDPEKYPPDLAIEVDVTSRSIPRMPVYEKLGISEVWRHTGTELIGLRLTEDRGYVRIERSLAFPQLRVADLNQFINAADRTSEFKAMKRFQRWIQRRDRGSNGTQI